MDSNTEIKYEYLPFFRAYKDGHIERLVGTETVPPSIDPTGVSSKDVLITPDGAISARLYLPKLTQNSPKFPILVYFHGGGFVVESSSSPTYHNYLNSVVSAANVVAVSVEYRRAPEHPLPTPHDDSWVALQWVASHADSSGEGPDVWLTKHADFGRLFLSGDSAGANIAHNMAMRVGLDGLNQGVKIHGLAIVHPYFWATPVAGSEGLDPGVKAIADIRNPLINPWAPSAPSLSKLGSSWVLVCLAEKDQLRDIGWRYYESLKKESCWGGVVEMFESKGENHCFHLSNPNSESAHVMMARLTSFFNH